jgi:hypothetical protein
MTRIFYSLICSLATLAIAAGIAHAQIELTRNSRSAYVIVRPADAIPAEVRAANELQRFIGEVSGVTLPIIDDRQPLPERAIVLGKIKGLPIAVNMVKLGKEGFVIRTKGKRIYIVGGRPRGTLYGVYQFLEDYLGCRWYSESVSKIPAQLSITLPAIDRTVVPVFEYREVYTRQSQNPEWAVRNRSNGTVPDFREEHGGKVKFPPNYFAHSSMMMVPQDKFYDTHPEYYALRGGVRMKDAGNAHLCYTNPDIVPIAIQSVRQILKEHPDTSVVSVSQMDGNFTCECPNCQAMAEREGSFSGPVLHFVNQVAEAIGKEFPNVWVETLAYAYSYDPPKNIKPAPNVLIRLCNIHSCYSHPKATCPVNEPTMQALTGWLKNAKHVYIWDYVTNFQHYHLPFPDLLVEAENIRLYEKLGVNGVFMQSSYAGRGAAGEFAELRCYLLAKLLWDPTLDVDTVINDFLQGYCGKAAPPIRQYIDLLHQHVSPAGMNYHLVYNSDEAAFITPELLEKADALFAQAHALVQDADPGLKLRVEVAEVPVLYARLFAVIGSEEDLMKAAARMADIGERGNLQHRSETDTNFVDFAKSYRPSRYQSLPDGSFHLGAQDLHLARPRHFNSEAWWVEITDDPAQPGKTVLHVPNTNHEWSIQWHPTRMVFKPNVKYALYIVAKVSKQSDTGPAFSAGLYNGSTNKSMIDRLVTAAEMPNGEWQRVKLGEFTATTESYYFWSAPTNNAEHVPDIYVDKFEIVPIAE